MSSLHDVSSVLFEDSDLDSEETIIQRIQALRENSINDQSRQYKMEPAELVEEAKLIRDANPSLWTSAVAIQFGELLKHVKERKQRVNETHYLRDVTKFPFGIDLKGELNQIEAEVVDPNELYISMYENDKLQFTVDCKASTKVCIGWSVLFLGCHAPWLIAIFMLLEGKDSNDFSEQLEQSYCRSSDLGRYLYGFAILLMVTVFVSVLLSLSQKVTAGESFIGNDEIKSTKNRATFAKISTFAMIAYNCWGLTIVWTPLPDQGCPSCQDSDDVNCTCCSQLVSLAIGVVIMFLFLPACCVILQTQLDSERKRPQEESEEAQPMEVA